MSSHLVPPKLLDTQAGADLQSGKDDLVLKEDGMWDLQEDVDVSAEERIFLEEFHLLKYDLEVRISKLHALADHMDTIHETFSKTNIVVNSITLVSGVISILGLALPAATLGGSLVFSAAGKGLQAAAAVTSMLTSICEHLHKKKVQAEASSLVPAHSQEDRKAEGQGVSYAAALGQVAYQCRDTIKDVKKNIHAFQRVRAHPRLAAAAKQFLTSGQVSARKSKQIQRAFEGTTLVMIKRARLLGIAKAGLFVSIDLATLLMDWKQLKEGTGSEAAKALRAQAHELEKLLTEVTQLYVCLQQQKFLQEKGLINCASKDELYSEGAM